MKRIVQRLFFLIVNDADLRYSYHTFASSVTPWAPRVRISVAYNYDRYYYSTSHMRAERKLLLLYENQFSKLISSRI